jgi:UDP-N-acetyl-D-mannosaminuronic acid dehydrogenase
MEFGADSPQVIGIVGGGFVGITLAAHLVQNSDLKVVLFERDTKKTELFRRGKYQVFEPELDAVLDKARSENRFKFEDESDENLDLIFICVGTPKGVSKEDQLAIFTSVIRNLEHRISENGMIFLRSTVSLGTTDLLGKEILNSGRGDMSLFFAPERTAEGNAMHELRTLPQVIGCALGSIGDGVSALKALGFTTVETSSAKTAELVKLTCNTWRDTIFAFANEIAMIADCEGIDSREVIKSANFNYVRGGIPKPGPVGGPCLSKDSHILISNLESHENSMILAARNLNESVTTRIASYIVLESKSRENYFVQFLGAAFKGNPFTNDVREGVADQLISLLTEASCSNLRYRITDKTLEREDLLGLEQYWTKSDFFEKPDMVVIGHDGESLFDPETVDYLQNLDNSVMIIDLWGGINSLQNLNAKKLTFGSGKFL